MDGPRPCRRVASLPLHSHAGAQRACGAPVRLVSQRSGHSALVSRLFARVCRAYGQARALNAQVERQRFPVTQWEQPALSNADFDQHVAAERGGAPHSTAGCSGACAGSTIAAGLRHPQTICGTAARPTALAACASTPGPAYGGCPSTFNPLRVSFVARLGAACATVCRAVL